MTKYSMAFTDNSKSIFGCSNNSVCLVKLSILSQINLMRTEHSLLGFEIPGQQFQIYFVHIIITFELMTSRENSNRLLGFEIKTISKLCFST